MFHLLGGGVFEKLRLSPIFINTYTILCLSGKSIFYSISFNMTKTGLKIVRKNGIKPINKFTLSKK